jgi:hypothetical protein
MFKVMTEAQHVASGRSVTFWDITPCSPLKVKITRRYIPEDRTLHKEPL